MLSCVSQNRQRGGKLHEMYLLRKVFPFFLQTLFKHSILRLLWKHSVLVSASDKVKNVLLHIASTINFVPYH